MQPEAVRPIKATATVANFLTTFVSPPPALLMHADQSSLIIEPQPVAGTHGERISVRITQIGGVRSGDLPEA